MKLLAVGDLLCYFGDEETLYSVIVEETSDEYKILNLENFHVWQTGKQRLTDRTKYEKNLNAWEIF